MEKEEKREVKQEDLDRFVDKVLKYKPDKTKKKSKKKRTGDK